MPSSLEIFQYHVFYSFITIVYLNTMYIHVCRCTHVDFKAKFVKAASRSFNFNSSNVISWMDEKVIFPHSGQDLRISRVFARALLIYKYLFHFVHSHHVLFYNLAFFWVFIVQYFLMSFWSLNISKSCGDSTIDCNLVS